MVRFSKHTNVKRQPFKQEKETKFWYIILGTRDLLDTKIFKQKGDDYISKVLGIGSKEVAFRKACKIYSRFLEMVSEDLLEGDEFKLPMNKQGSFFIKEEKTNYAKYLLDENYKPTANIYFNLAIDVFIRNGKHYFIKPRKHLKWDAENKMEEGFNYLKNV